MALIELVAVRFRYEDMAMCFDVAIEAGEFVAVIGPSGAGKSTFVNLIAGFDTPLSGTVRIDGRDMNGVPPARRPVTTLFQDHNLFGHLTVEQNIGLGLDPGLRLTAAHRARITEALGWVGLDGMAARLPRELSGGERQRVALARSIVRDRPILLLDEPFAALGPALRLDMVALVDRLRRQRGMTVVMVSHQIEDVAGVATRALFVDAGRIRADGPIDELLRDPSPELAAYLRPVG